MNVPYYVVDASVVAKWVLSDELHEENALKLKRDLLSGLASLSAPSFMLLEVGNTLWKAAKRVRITQEDAQSGLETLNAMKIKLHEFDWTHASQILNAACKLDLTVYDAAYLFLSERMKATFVTADGKLCEKAKKYFDVLHIKDYT